MKRLIIVLAACGGSAAPGPYGWWNVGDEKAAEDLRGAALKLAPDQMIVVSGKLVATRACPTTVTGTRLAITGCGPRVEATLDGDRLVFDKGFTATRAGAARIKEIEATIAASDPDACDRARRCYRVAWPALGLELREDFDFGPGPSNDQCQQMHATFRDKLVQAGKPVPDACK